MTRSRKAARRAAAAPPLLGAPAATPSPWLRRAPWLAALVAFLVYLPSVAGGFLYDDGELILRNPSIRELSALATILRYEPSRPLLNLSWALNYALGGEAPWHYHLVNVLIHAGNAALLATLFLWMARHLGRRDAPQLALLGACLFAASPMAGETVAYVASRSSALVTLITLASLRVAVSVLDGGPRRRLGVAFGLFLLALATKEEAAALPLLLLLLDYFFASGRQLELLRRRLWLHALFFAVIPLGLVARRLATGSWLPPQAIEPARYLLTQWAAFPLYFFRSLVPLDPALYRHHDPAPWPPDAATVVFAIVTAVMATIAVARRREWPEWSFAVACLAAGLAPSSSIVSLNEMVVDHRAYLGSFGIAFLLGTVLWRLGGMRLGIVVVALFAARALWFERVLADPVRAWEHVVARSPQSMHAVSALAEAYSERDDPRAEALFRRLTEWDPGSSRSWASLGLYYGEHGRPAEAVEALRRALERQPGDAAVQDYLGQLLAGLGRDDEAALAFEAAIAAEPGFAPAYSNLAAVLLRRGEVERARELIATGSGLAGSTEEAQAFDRLRERLP